MTAPYVAAAAAILAVAAAVWWLRRRRPTPEQLECARRLRLHAIGRLAAGEILDLIAAPAEAGEQAPPTLLYQYEVRGVTYEASQPLYLVPVPLDPRSWIPGLPVQVKYDPVNPGNSIVACEHWNGLSARKSAGAGSLE
ncbi:MAG: hypothetical protein ACRD1C_09035 [Terriglobales bacterium]